MADRAFNDKYEVRDWLAELVGANNDRDTYQFPIRSSEIMLIDNTGEAWLIEVNQAKVVQV